MGMQDVLYLAVCAVKGIVPNADRVEKLNLEQLYKLSQFHSLTAVVCEALESAGVSDEKFKEAKAKAIRKTLLMDVERTNLFSFMEQQGIWYMPLKGVILKDMYPKLGMRQMADNDILFDEKFREQVQTWFVERGYKSHIGTGYHDEYTKEPFYNYEMHYGLYAENHTDGWMEYYRNVKERLIKDEGNHFGYHFSDEDFYIYFVTHAYKHYDGSGTGLRTLLDTGIYLQKKKSSLNWEYIQKVMEQLQIADYESSSRSLAEHIFANIDYYTRDKPTGIPENEAEMLEYFLYSGTYGTLKNKVDRDMKKLESDTGKSGRFTYWVRRIWPEEKFLKVNYPFFYKHKWIRPVAPIYRLCKGLIKNPKKIQNEIKYVKGNKGE